MGTIAAVEDAIVAEVDAVLGNTVRRRETLPGGWTLDTLQRALQFAPGVYVTFQGLTAGKAKGYHDARFSVYVLTKGASEVDRRRGNPRVMGAYDILERLLPRLDGLTVAGVGALGIRGVDNLFRDAMFDLGGTVYGINLSLPNMPFETQADPATLDDFITFDARYDLDPAQDGEPAAEDHVTGLDQL